MEILTVPLDLLVPDPANPRAHSTDNIDAIRNSLQRFGQVLPILVRDSDSQVVAGNGTLEAMRELGWTECKVALYDGDDAECRALSVALNRTAELATWDEANLAAAVGELRASGFDAMESLGFDSQALDDLAEQFKTGSSTGMLPPLAGAEVQQDEVPEPPAQAVTRPGDVWTLGRHRLMCGSVTTFDNMGQVDMLLTDPPYCSGGFQEAGRRGGSVGTRGDELVHNDQLSTRGYQSLIRKALQVVGAGIVYVFTDWRMWVNLFDVVESEGYGVRNMVVWDKGTPGMGRGWRHQHELIMCGSRVAAPFDPHKAQGNVIQCARTGNKLHATEKPVELIAKIMVVTDMAVSVADPFAGSGTTLIAAEQLGRTCHAVELDPRYCDVVVERWQALTGQQATRG